MRFTTPCALITIAGRVAWHEPTPDGGSQAADERVEDTRDRARNDHERAGDVLLRQGDRFTSWLDHAGTTSFLT